MVLKPFWIFNVIMHSQYNCNIVHIVNVCVSKQQCFKFKLCILRQYSERLAFVCNTMDNKERNEQDLLCCESIHKLDYHV